MGTGLEHDPNKKMISIECIVAHATITLSTSKEGSNYRVTAVLCPHCVSQGYGMGCMLKPKTTFFDYDYKPCGFHNQRI